MNVVRAAIVSLAFVGALLGPMRSAMAEVLNFEDPEIGNGLGLGVPPGEDPSFIISKGYEIRVTRSFAVIWGTFGDGAFATIMTGNGTNRIMAFNQNSVIVTAVDGRPFNLASFDGGEAQIVPPFGWATQISVTGTTADGSAVNEVFDLDLIRNLTDGLQTFVPTSAFQNLTSLEFRAIGTDPDFSLDNIVLTKVPEPRTAALIAIGLLGLFGFRKPLSR